MTRLAQANSAAKVDLLRLKQLSSMALSSSLDPFADGLRVAERKTRNLVLSHEKDSGMVLRVNDEFFQGFSA